MGIIEIAVIVMATALVALTCFAIPVLVELRRTMTELRQTSARTESEMKKAVQDLHNTFVELQHFTMEATERLEDVKPFTQSLSETGRHVRTINSVLGAVTGAIAGSTLWVTGAKVAGKFVLDRFTRKGGNRNG